MSDNQNTNETLTPGKPSLPPLTKKQKWIKEAKSIFWIILLVLAFRSVFYEPFRIPSGSMIPTLMIGDFILVDKFAYGLKLPFSDWFTDPVYIAGKKGPNRGDIIVFKYPKDTSINYIKRVVGLPGDVIEIRNKVVYINDQPLENPAEISPEKYMGDMDEKFKMYNFKFYQAKTGEHQHIIAENVDNYFKADYEKRQIPPDQYFVMGDNRDFSADSRYWGYVPFAYIKGRALMVWFSLIFPWDENGFKFRPGRIGDILK
ncbi:MAG: signal peptidase I [Pseudomonadota bacterium]